MTEKKVYITTSIPYVNASPHIGYALEVVQADVLKRWHALKKAHSFLLAGTDENAIKNVESAEKLGITTQELVDKNAAEFEKLLQVLKISNDDFIRTTSDKHIKGAQKLWKLCKSSNPDDIYEETYEGLYCVGCETFYKDGEFKDNICPYHNRKLELVKEKNWFFRLSKYKKYLKDLISSDELHIYPAFRKLELLNFIDKLEDISISRPNERTKGWGVPVPDDSSQRMYVWFDALANYITALNFGTDGDAYNEWWQQSTQRYHCIGKDIIKFHALYWPAMLKSANLTIPTGLFVHGFINVEGKKMSKSLGNVIDPFELVKKYGLDATRYYLLREIPSLDDGDFSISRMDELYRSDLSNELGNLLMRITTLAAKDEIHHDSPKHDVTLHPEEYAHQFEEFQFNAILEDIWKKIKQLNKETDTFAPWKKTTEERKEFLVTMLDNLLEVGLLLRPFLPDTAAVIIKSTTADIQKGEPLFPRIS
ncbi:MAG: hypothetical protein RI947_1371 [Candidatus Parcubacteria bacterium]|jgi:methionyl-tRNA synthetase